MTNETKMKTGAQLLVDALEKQEVEMIFGFRNNNMDNYCPS